MRALRKMLRIYATDEEDYDAVAASTWEDIEDAFVFQTAMKVKADAIITRDASGFSRSSIPTFTCEELFIHLADEMGLEYGTTAF